MTDIRDQIDLDEYSKLLADLESEVREYGKQRKSLQDIVRALRALEKTSTKAVERTSLTIESGEQVFARLTELDLPRQVTELQNRYDSHQRRLGDIMSGLNALVQEQQRASLESLQGTQHTRELFERYAKAAQSTAEAHDKRLDEISEQVSTLSHELGSVSVLINEGKRQQAISQTIAIATLIVLVVFAVASFTI